MYNIKEDVAKMIKAKYKILQMAEEIGVQNTLLSVVLNNKRKCTKKVAYCITKWVDKDAEIDDFFIKCED